MNDNLRMLMLTMPEAWGRLVDAINSGDQQDMDVWRKRLCGCCMMISDEIDTLMRHSHQTTDTLMERLQHGRRTEP